MGMLLFVWLSMAIAPCVMAQELQRSDVGADNSALHSKMKNCAYCPGEHHSMEYSVHHDVLCQNAHDIFSDSLSLVTDSVDVVSFVLFEIPAALPIQQFRAGDNPFKLQKNSAPKPIPPLDLTGILQI